MSEELKAQFKKTYQLEVEFAERDDEGNAKLGMIEVPWISSDQYFTISSSPELTKFFGEDRKLTELESNEFLSKLGRMLVETLVPGMLSQLTPLGGFGLIGAILKKEAKTFGLGEVRKNQRTKKK